MMLLHTTQSSRPLFMKPSNLSKIAALLMALSLCKTSSAELITIEEAEKQRAAIMSLDTDLDTKLQKLTKLEQLIKKNNEITDLLAPPQQPEVEKEKIESAIKVAVTKERDSILQSQQADRVAKMRELFQTTDSGIYLTYYFEIGNEIKADLIVNGNKRGPVDVISAINNKKKFGNYRIIAAGNREITVFNYKTKQTQTLPVMRSSEVLNRIAYQNSITMEYAKSILMGELNNDLKQQSGSGSSNNLPLQVDYKTMSKPMPFDSGK